MNKSNVTRQDVPDLRELLNRLKVNIKSEINCMTLGTIQSFDPVTQTVSVKINFQRLVKEAVASEDSYSADKIYEYPLLVNCPAVIMNGGGGILTFPIAAGDTCIVMFCDRDIENWFEEGQTAVPNSERLHDLSDGIALVGIYSKANNIANYFDGIKVTLGGGFVTIDKSGNIVVDSPGTVIVNAPKVNIKGALSADVASLADAIIRGEELSIGAPADTVPPFSTSETRRVWVVTSVVGNVVTLEERRLGLSVPPAPLTRTVTVE